MTFFKGSHDLTTGRLLAHELGHLFGSNHDGGAPTSTSVYYGTGRYKESNTHNNKILDDVVPCPPGVHLMSGSVSQSMTTWSNCTTNMIDRAAANREEEENNCLPLDLVKSYSYNY